MMDPYVTLSFDNPEAVDSSFDISTTESAVAKICRWYACFHADDHFSIRKDGTVLKMDVNGELL